jgi:hypothetical protein
MPAAATADRKKGKAAPARAVKPEEDPDDALTSTVRKALIIGFHKAQQTTSSHMTQRKIIFKHLEQYPAVTTTLLCALCVKTLSMQQAADITKRHCAFLADVCKTQASEKHTDHVASEILQAVLPYHGAKDKNVRFGVCSVLEALLRTLLPDVDTDERHALYDRIVEALKLRSLDVYPRRA